MKKRVVLGLISILTASMVLSGCEFSFPFTPVQPENDNEKPVSLVATDNLKNAYLTTDIFDEHVDIDGLNVKLSHQDNSTKSITKDEYTYVITDSSNKEIDATKKFSKPGEYNVSVSYPEVPTVSYKLNVNAVSPIPTEKTLSRIRVSDYSQKATLNQVYTFDGTVTAIYSDSSTADVTNSPACVIKNPTTTKLGVSTGSVTYSEKGITKSMNFSVDVEEQSGPAYETISVEEAVSIINGLEENVISDEEYYVRGIVTGVEQDVNGFNGSFLNSNLKFRSIKENGVADSVDDIDGKEVIMYGYLENYRGIYQIPYLPATASPTGVKYNGKLIWVESDSGDQTIEPSNISISPVNKTLKLNEVFTLSPTVLPENATDKSITWSSDNQSVCSVSSSGVLKGLSVGTAVITAKTFNNLTATCNVTVVNNESSEIEGNKYEIAFNKYEVDGQSELNSTSILEQITAGSGNISSFTDISKLYKGINGVKFGSNRSGGQMAFTLSKTLQSLDCSEIIVDCSIYGTKSTTVSIYGDDDLLVSGSSADPQVVAKLSKPRKIEELAVTTSSRAYISKITLVCGEIEEVPVTGISIPSTKSVSLGNTAQLSVTYTPSNANTGKNITWTSNKTGVATVNNGLITGVSTGTAVITATSQGGFKSTCTVTVSEIAVSSVSLSPTSATVSVGSTKQLNATISPSDASNKTLTWSSSDTTVASVSSSGLVTAKAVGNATITVKTANNKQATCAITVTKVTKDAWTVLIYMCGADLESESGLASGDIKEILSVGSQPSDVNIVIETGGAKSWSLKNTSTKTYLSGASSIDASKLQRWHIENKKLTFDESVSTYTSMGSSSTLQSFIEYGIKEYPAEKTGLIFWNHGGAMYGCCYDEKKNDDALTNSEMKTAFSNALRNTGSDKLEFVGYDTCLTQVQDIAEFNSNYFNYMIASEEAEAGEGWDYDTWVDNLYAKDSTPTILKAIVDGFITDNGGVNSTRSDQTLSYLDLSSMAAYKTAFESFASALKSKLNNGGVSKSDFASWMSKNVKAFCVDTDEDEKYYCLFDVKDMLNKLSSNSSYNPGSSYISALNTAFSNLVKYSVAQKGAGNAYGLGCIYCQSSTYSSYLKRAYTDTETSFTNWFSFCKTYSYLA